MSITKITKAVFSGHFLAGFLVASLTLLGCTHHDGDAKAGNGAKTGAAMSGEQVVNLAIWGNYLSADLIKKFETENGIKINISNYASNEELLAKVQAGAAGIDVAVPSDYMVAVLRKLDLLHEIDRAQVPNAAHLSAGVIHQSFDPDNKYSMPYDWSTAGIAVNRTLFKGVIKGWHDVFNNPELVGKISMLDDVREVAAAALKYNGFSVNSVDPAELKAAEATLISLKAKVKMFRSDAVDPLLKKEVAVAQSFSTDALQANVKSGGNIEYILPEEGGTRSIDTLVILKNSQNLTAAHKLVNFLLSQEVNVAFVKAIWAGPILDSTRARLPTAMQNNPVLFPAEGKLSKFENIQDLGANTRLYDEMWTRVKTE